MNALLLVDIQNDFLTGGALAVDHGDQIVSVANRMITEFPLVIATQDWHPVNHQSFVSQHPGCHVGDRLSLHGVEQQLWPDHCVQGTFGAELCDQLRIEDIDQLVRKGTDRNIDSYSAFFDNAGAHESGLAETLHAHDVQSLHVVGLTTEYCVQFTVLDALKLGFHVVVHTAGIRGVEHSLGDCRRAIERMQAAGAEIR